MVFKAAKREIKRRFKKKAFLAAALSYWVFSGILPILSLFSSVGPSLTTAWGFSFLFLIAAPIIWFTSREPANFNESELSSPEGRGYSCADVYFGKLTANIIIYLGLFAISRIVYSVVLYFLSFGRFGPMGVELFLNCFQAFATPVFGLIVLICFFNFVDFTIKNNIVAVLCIIAYIVLSMTAHPNINDLVALALGSIIGIGAAALYIEAVLCVSCVLEVLIWNALGYYIFKRRKTA